MKAYAIRTPVDRIKHRGGKKAKYCPCCISGKIHPESKSQKHSARQQAKNELRRNDNGY